MQSGAIDAQGLECVRSGCHKDPGLVGLARDCEGTRRGKCGSGGDRVSDKAAVNIALWSVMLCVPRLWRSGQAGERRWRKRESGQDRSPVIIRC